MLKTIFRSSGIFSDQFGKDIYILNLLLYRFKQTRDSFKIMKVIFIYLYSHLIYFNKTNDFSSFNYKDNLPQLYSY